MRNLDNLSIDDRSLSAYDYDLDPRLIAQVPCALRDESALMVIDRKTGGLHHEKFSALVNYLNPGDVLVRNNTRVFPARIVGRKATGATVEFLLLEHLGEDTWLVICKPAKRVRLGDVFLFADHFKAEVIGVQSEGKRVLLFGYSGDFWQHLDRLGRVPIPPYIHADQMSPDFLKERYQTVFAQQMGSAAAPTAGLHFTEDVFSQLHTKGVEVVDVTLHVGLGTFLPVTAENISEHHMHSESYEVPSSTRQRLLRARQQGRRIVAIGTTSARVLETIVPQLENEVEQTLSGKTSIFIYPGYQFQLVDVLLTNFHLPKSSLLMLISAFYNRIGILNAYALAQQMNYRFFSFGDAMLIL